VQCAMVLHWLFFGGTGNRQLATLHRLGPSLSTFGSKACWIRNAELEMGSREVDYSRVATTIPDPDCWWYW